MATTPEGKVKAAVTKVLKAYGAYYFFPATGGFGKSGVFDICVCYHGYFIGIETKADCKKLPTGLQSRNAEQAYEAGASVLLIHNENLHVLAELLERISNEKTRFDRTNVWTTKST